MKCVMTMCLSLALLTGCQVATGLTELAVVEQDGGPDPVVAGRRAKGGSGGGGEGGAGGESGKGGAGGGRVEMITTIMANPIKVEEGGSGGRHQDEGGKGGDGGSGGAAGDPAPHPASGGSGGAASSAGAGGAAGDAHAVKPCDRHGAACDIVNSCGCEGEQVCGIVKQADKLQIGCRNTVGRASIGNSCKTIDDCVPGSICIGAKDTSICRKACYQDAECGADSACLRIKDFDEIGFCAETCVSNSDCASTNCCIPSGEGVNFCTATAACKNPPQPNTDMMSTKKAVGAACTTAADCQSNNCHNSLCHGTHQDGATCTNDLDCAGHTCVSELLNGPNKVCISARDACKQMNIDDCYIDLATAACQLANKCSTTKLSSFDACVRSSCVEAPKDYPLSQCQSAHDGFMSDHACPTPNTNP